jgi:hypothetical protein
MFDLEKAVGEWRAAQAALPASVLDELEEHLRSSMETLAATGLSSDEAFLVARHRLGTPSQLDSEFEKVPGAYAERRLRWMLAGVIAASLVPGVMHIVSVASAFAGVGLGVSESVLPWIVVLSGTLLFVWAWRRVIRMPAGGREGLVAFVEGDPTGRRSRLRVGALIVGAFVAVSVLNWALRSGMAHAAGPASVGYTAIGNSILGGLTSLTLLVGSVFLLARRRPTPFAR